MDPARTSELLGLFVCLVIVSIASAAEAALSTISRHRLNSMLDRGEQRVQAVMRLLEDPYQVRLASLVLGTSATVAATALALTFMDTWSALWQWLGLFGFLLIWLAIGTVVPKTIATAYPDRTATAILRPLQLLIWLVLPIQLILRILVQPIGIVTGSKPQLVTEEELKLLVNVGEEEGVIEATERQMIQGIFEFSDTLVREVMVPRIDITAINVTTPLNDALHVVLDAGHSRVPVYENSIDHIVGVLYAKDLLPVLQAGRHNAPLSALVRAPYFVPDTMKVDELLKALRIRHVHMAIIVDEYGGTAGLATIEDVVEEIVGEIQDEYDVEEPPIQKISTCEWLIDGRISLDEVNDLTGLTLDHNDVDSLGGYVSTMLGTIPIMGDTITQLDATIEVVAVRGLRPQRLRVLRPQTAEEPDIVSETVGEHG